MTGAGTMAVLLQGTDNQLWEAAYDGTAWTWHPEGGVLASPPMAVSAGAGTVDAFVQGTDSALWRWSSASGWASPGGKILGKTAAGSMTARRLDVMVQGTDPAISHRSD